MRQHECPTLLLLVTFPLYRLLLLLLLLMIVGGTDAFVARPVVSKSRSGDDWCGACTGSRTANGLPAKPDDKGEEQNSSGGFFQGLNNFFQEIDNFMDDASARRLGNGSAFYGKRKSNFYGSQDKNRKADPTQADPLEDFQAPLSGGYYQWMPDDEGQMRPVTRMKNTIVERNPNFWDKVFEDKEQQKRKRNSD